MQRQARNYARFGGEVAKAGTIAIHRLRSRQGMNGTGNGRDEHRRGDRQADPLEELRRFRAAQLQRCAVDTRKRVREMIDAGQKAAGPRGES